MTFSDIGALGQVMEAVGVIATLIYLSVQIRQNTHAMEENRRLALAQTYQMRADALQEMVVNAANAELGQIISILNDMGYPGDITALDRLTPEQRARFRLWQIAQQTHWDNLHFQYQQGFLDDEYYEHAFKERVIRLAPVWRALGLTGGRRSFFEEIATLEAASGKEQSPASRHLVK